MTGDRAVKRSERTKTVSVHPVRVRREVFFAIDQVAKARRTSAGHLSSLILESWYEDVYKPHMKKAGG